MKTMSWSSTWKTSRFSGWALEAAGRYWEALGVRKRHWERDWEHWEALGVELGPLGALGEALEGVFHDNEKLIVNVEDLQVLRVGTGVTGRYWGALGIRKRHGGVTGSTGSTGRGSGGHVP